MSTQPPAKVLVIGATGYVGSRLVPNLLSKGYRVRAAGRSLDKLRSREWAESPNVELRAVDVLDAESLRSAVDGCSHIYYLVHSMNPSSTDFEASDRAAARNLVEVVGPSAVKQIIYLGGLGEQDENLSKHLRSRAEVASILREAKTATTILRAAMIIGSGSASFEILRYLVDRLPVMVTPRWVRTKSQPIAIRNVLTYLVGCLDDERTFNEVFDIGGPEIVSYSELMNYYADEAHVHRPLVVPVPVFTPRLSSYWINFVTPVPGYIARPLAEGLKNPAVCEENRIRELIPQQLLSCREAIRLAVDKIQHHQVQSHWTDAGKLQKVEWFNSADPGWAGGTVFSDVRKITIEGSPADAWRALSRIGGTTGWYYANWLWQLRGALDRLVGGVGLRRGRRDNQALRVGDALDFWRIYIAEPEQRLLLIAEMKLPGQAALQFSINKLDGRRTEIIQTARFLPSGLLGLAYWFTVFPLHELIFTGMLRGIANASGCPVVSPPDHVSTAPRGIRDNARVPDAASR